MMHNRCFFALVLGLSLIASGCHTAPGRKFEDAIQNIRFKNRQPGEHQQAEEKSVARKLGCKAGSGSVVRINSHQVLPERVTPGREINHRIVYSACGLGAATNALLIRRVSFNGRVLMEQKSSYTLKGGRWMVDAFVGVPSQAQSGSYRLELRLECGDSILSATDDFTVEQD